MKNLKEEITMIPLSLKINKVISTQINHIMLNYQIVDIDVNESGSYPYSIFQNELVGLNSLK